MYPGTVMEMPPTETCSGPERDHRIATKEISVTAARRPPIASPRLPGDEQPNVVGDALVGVVALASRELHPVVGAIGQPRAKVPLGEPSPPADQEHLVEVELVDGHDDVRDREPREANDLPDEDRVVLFLQRVVEGVVPAVEEDVEVDHAQRERDHDDEQPQRGPAILGGPVGARDTPAIAHQSTKPTHATIEGS